MISSVPGKETKKNSDTLSKGLLTDGNTTYNFSFFKDNKQVITFDSVIIGSKVNMELSNINFTNLFSHEPYQFNPTILVSFGDSSCS